MKHKSIFDYMVDQEFLRAHGKRNAELHMKEGLRVFVLKPVIQKF